MSGPIKWKTQALNYTHVITQTINQGPPFNFILFLITFFFHFPLFSLSGLILTYVSFFALTFFLCFTCALHLISILSLLDFSLDLLSSFLSSFLSSSLFLSHNFYSLSMFSSSIVLRRHHASFNKHRSSLIESLCSSLKLPLPSTTSPHLHYWSISALFGLWVYIFIILYGKSRVFVSARNPFCWLKSDI